MENLGRPDGGDAPHLRYLAFVDGLRAISILAVVAFHVGLPGVPGGFVGVDVFFVISGFLIINQIKDGLTAGRFSILSFYAGRTLRILPPFIIMVAVTDLVAPFVLQTTSMAWSFVPSAGLAPFMVSNIVFLVTQGYFDISAVQKPLLHTWTLSVEEQFYLCAPLLLPLVFWLGRRRFGAQAIAIGAAIALVSFVSAVAVRHGAPAQSAAFYLPHARAWEFLAGGFIGARAAATVRSLPRALVDVMGWAGLGCIVLAALIYDPAMTYPSWYAALPVAGAAFVILSGLADPKTTVARFLSLRGMVAIGVVSYGWYLWHWPILSFMRIMRLNDSALAPDLLGGGLAAFVLACLSYRYVELPIRRWRKSSANMAAMKNPGRIVVCGLLACSVLAAAGAGDAVAVWWSARSHIVSRYGVEGRGVLNNGCQRSKSSSPLPEHCYQGPVGLLVGDSHASVLFGSYAKFFDGLGIGLTSAAGPGCMPTLFAPGPRKENRTHRCARGLAPFERLLARPEPVRFVIISSKEWGYEEAGIARQAALVSDLIAQFDPQRTRILLIGQVPMFPKAGLECVVFSDRFGISRDRCTVPRRDVEARNAAITGVLKSMAARFGNVRYVDPLDVFCDATTCRPYRSKDGADTVVFGDEHHVTSGGADAIHDAFASDFTWLAEAPGERPPPE